MVGGGFGEGLERDGAGAVCLVASRTYLSTALFARPLPMRKIDKCDMEEFRTL